MEAVLSLVPRYGSLLLLAITFLSCLALPVPASLAMLAAGAFAAAGDLSVAGVVAAAFAGAVAGDQLGYWAGRRGGPLLDRMSATRRAGPLLLRARAALASRLWATVFLSRWLFSPLGPYVNLAGGAARLHWRAFTLAAAAGEAVWVGLYVGVGFVFAAQVDQAGETMGAVLGLLAAAAVTALLGRALWQAAQRRPGQRSDRA